MQVRDLCDVDERLRFRDANYARLNPRACALYEYDRFQSNLDELDVLKDPLPVLPEKGTGS